MSPYLDSLSDDVIHLADELSFPLIDIHQSIPLSDVMMGIFKEIFNKQASLLERIEKVHEQFMAVMLEGNGIEEVTQVIHDNIKNPVIINLDISNQMYEKLGGFRR